ncbi:MAG: helix-turn-helix domain-containing protein [Clostridia bacterium]|nr:helix-turn-helix domain-containing protein [Clostridia bacterium]
MSQKEISARSGVSLASYRRFEQSGEISLHSLLKVAAALGYLSDFENLFKEQKITSLKDYGK